MLLDDLKADLKDSRVLAIVGAGVSIAATRRAAMASWRGLLHDGVQRCLDTTPCPEGWADRMRAEIEGDTVDLVCAAENICQRLGAPDAGEYGRWLADTVGKLEVLDQDVISALADLDVPIATTNYDSLIEDATGLRPVLWRDRRRTESFVQGRSDGVLHVHGHWEEPESVVLGIRSYEDILRDEYAQNMLRTLRTMRTLLFIGFGDGLRDPNFGALLKWSGRVFAESPGRQYRLCVQAEAEQVRPQHPAEERMCVLAFGAEHSALGPYLRELRGGARA